MFMQLLFWYTHTIHTMVLVLTTPPPGPMLPIVDLAWILLSREGRNLGLNSLSLPLGSLMSLSLHLKTYQHQSSKYCCGMDLYTQPDSYQQQRYIIILCCINNKITQNINIHFLNQYTKSQMFPSSKVDISTCVTCSFVSMHIIFFP